MSEGIRFFSIWQNNIHGYHYVNDDVAEYVVVEAFNANDATERFDKIIEKYWSSCDCCGGRWDTIVDEDDGSDTPMIRGKKISDISATAIIYYLDGSVQKINY